MNLEGALLTGGASRRMGADKASILLNGEPMAVRVAKALAERCEKVTILGRVPIEGFAFIQDEEEYAGPLFALSRFQPTADLVFLASCDLVCFGARLVDDLLTRLGDRAAVIPVHDGKAQPLCALYRAEALARLQEMVLAGERRMMAWVASIDALEVAATDLPHGRACRSVNTVEELTEYWSSGVVE
jgi:molybdopterin-guanine dinucleotide biosynthesis protein A